MNLLIKIPYYNLMISDLKSFKLQPHNIRSLAYKEQMDQTELDPAKTVPTLCYCNMKFAVDRIQIFI